MKISVLTPSFNSAKYLRRAVDSVVAQSYTNWEHIIMDGGSKDGTVGILESYPHLIWKSEKDNGQSEAMNKAFDKATGDLIVYLNADDEFEPNIFQTIISQFKNDRKANMLIGKLRVQYPDGPKIVTPSDKLADILGYSEFRFPLNPVSYFYKRSLQEKIGPFPVDNHYTMDYWFLLEAYSRATIINSDAIFGTFYFDGTNKSADGERAMKGLEAVRKNFIKNNFYKPRVATALLRKLMQRMKIIKR